VRSGAIAESLTKQVAKVIWQVQVSAGGLTSQIFLSPGKLETPI